VGNQVSGIQSGPPFVADTDDRADRVASGVKYLTSFIRTIEESQETARRPGPADVITTNRSGRVSMIDAGVPDVAAKHCDALLGGTPYNGQNSTVQRSDP
jgi:hypothetical protein